MILTRDHFAAYKPRTRTVELPDLNGSAIVREMKAAEVVEYSSRQKVDPLTAIYYAIRVTLLTEAGQPMYSGPEDEALIASLPYKVIDALVDAVLDLTGLKAPAEKK